MKLNSINPVGLLSITSYDSDHVAVGGQRLESSFLLTPRHLIKDWTPQSFDTLNIDDIRAMADLNCQVILLGTGTRQRFPAPALLAPLIDRRLGFEIMDNFAACRTYNVLASEGRDVALALILERPA